MALLDDDFSDFGLSDDSDGDEESKLKETFPDVSKEISFERWTELPAELKTLVVSHMNYVTRYMLSFCSKLDYEIVSSTPIQLRSIVIENIVHEFHCISKDPIENVSVRIELEEDKSITLHFFNRENGTHIGWMAQSTELGRKPKFVRLEGCDHYEEAVKFVEKWLKQSRYSVKSMTVEMKNWPFEKSGIQFLPQCEEVRICNENESTLKWWLERVHPSLKSLQLSNRDSETPLSSEILAMDHFKMCNRMYIWGNANFTDDQFLSLTAFRFSIESNTITDKAINTFIRKWIDGNIHEKFYHFNISISREMNKDEVLKNVNFRPWDEEFENEMHGFCGDWERVMGRGDCSQISKSDNSGISATLNIMSDSISFSVTGRRINYNGRITTSYSLPFGL